MTREPEGPNPPKNQSSIGEDIITTAVFWGEGELFCDPTGLLQESLGPFGPEASPECPRECPRKWGVSEGVSEGVSPECQKGVPDTPGTLSGHFLDIPEPGARRAPGTPRHSLGHPPLSGTLSGHSGTLRARRARETPVAGRRDRKNCFR